MTSSTALVCVISSARRSVAAWPSARSYSHCAKWVSGVSKPTSRIRCPSTAIVSPSMTLIRSDRINSALAAPAETNSTAQAMLRQSACICKRQSAPCAVVSFVVLFIVCDFTLFLVFFILRLTYGATGMHQIYRLSVVFGPLPFTVKCSVPSGFTWTSRCCLCAPILCSPLIGPSLWPCHPGLEMHCDPWFRCRLDARVSETDFSRSPFLATGSACASPSNKKTVSALRTLRFLV